MSGFRTLHDPDLLHPARHCVHCGIQFRLHTSGRDAGVDQRPAIRPSSSSGQDLFRRIEHAIHIGKKDQPVRVPAGRDGHRHRIGITLKTSPVALRPPRTPPPAGMPPPPTRRAARGSNLDHLAHRSQLGSSCSAMASPASMPVRPTACRAGECRARYKLRIHGARRRPSARRLSSLPWSPAARRTKRLSMPRSSRNRVICLPPPWTTATRCPARASRADLPRDASREPAIIQQRAADLDQRLQSSPSVSSNPSRRFRF